MEILVHGTKGGHKSSLIPNNETSLSLDDIRIGVNNNSPLGKSLYTLTFNNGGCFFSKYTIVRDTLRSYATGFVAFSLFLPLNKELYRKGVDVKLLLDSLSNHYIDKYVKDNNINRGESELIREDWSFIDKTLNEFKEQEKSFSDQEILSGTQEPAFHYYKSDSELIELFDKPYQEEYSNYKQILLIDLNLKGSGNPLQVLKNSGIEINPDLENTPYRLRAFDGYGKNGIKITIINSKGRELQNKDRIYRKEKLTLIYSKNYYKDKKIYGSLVDSDEIKEYLKVNSDNTIDVEKSCFLEPEIKTVYFQVQDSKGNPKNDAIITCKNNFSLDEEGTTNNQIDFSGDELKYTWSVTARSIDSIGNAELVPIEQNEPVMIKVEERKNISLKIKDEDGNEIKDFEVSYKLIKGFQRINTLEFVDEQIQDSYEITIRKKGYQDKIISKFKPYEQNTINETLSTKQKPINGKPGSFFSDFHNVASLVALVLVLGVFIFLGVKKFVGKKPPKEIPVTAQQITNYVEGDSLFRDKLIQYKENWNKNKPESQTADPKKWYNPTTWFIGGNEKISDSNFDSTLQSLDRAIKKREWINSKNFAELKNQRYSMAQQSFKNAISKIDSIQYSIVAQKLGDIAALTLSQIADSINIILIRKEQIKPQEPKKEEEENIKKKEPSVKKDQPKEKPKQQEEKVTPPPAVKETVTSGKTTEIIDYIRGGELNKDKLTEYLNTKGITPDLRNSIQLCLDFWELDGSGTKTYWAFRNKLDDSKTLKNSKLKAFVDKMCQEGSNPSYSEQDKKRGIR